MAPVDGSGSMPACITFVPNLIIYNLGCQGTKKSKWRLDFGADCSAFFFVLIYSSQIFAFIHIFVNVFELQLAVVPPILF